MTQNNQNRDPTIDEIHQIRQQMSEKFNGDTAAILEDARKRQAASGRPIWQPPTPTNALSPTTNGPPDS